MEQLRDFFETPLIVLAGTQVTIGQLAFAMAVVLVGTFVAKFIERLLARRLATIKMNADSIQLLKRLVFYALLAIIIVSALGIIGIPLTAFAFVSGAIAIGVGFGAQNIINNFISGWILMGERPIRIGDFVEIQDRRGTVESINSRSTRIRRTDGVHLLIPNSYLLENIVVNWTLVDRDIRTSVRVGVAYGSPVRRVADLILQAVTEHRAVLSSPQAHVYFDDFGDNALAFEAFFWCQASAERDLRAVRSDIRFRLEELFGDAGIVIAFPQRDVHVDGAITLVPDGANIPGAAASEPQPAELGHDER